MKTVRFTDVNELFERLSLDEVGRALQYAKLEQDGAEKKLRSVVSEGYGTLLDSVRSAEHARADIGRFRETLIRIQEACKSYNPESLVACRDVPAPEQGGIFVEPGEQIRNAPEALWKELDLQRYEAAARIILNAESLFEELPQNEKEHVRADLSCIQMLRNRVSSSYLTLARECCRKTVDRETFKSALSARSLLDSEYDGARALQDVLAVLSKLLRSVLSVPEKHGADGVMEIYRCATAAGSCPGAVEEAALKKSANLEDVYAAWEDGIVEHLEGNLKGLLLKIDGFKEIASLRRGLSEVQNAADTRLSRSIHTCVEERGADLLAAAASAAVREFSSALHSAIEDAPVRDDLTVTAEDVDSAESVAKTLAEDLKRAFAELRQNCRDVAVDEAALDAQVHAGLEKLLVEMRSPSSLIVPIVESRMASLFPDLKGSAEQGLERWCEVLASRIGNVWISEKRRNYLEGKLEEGTQRPTKPSIGCFLFMFIGNVYAKALKKSVAPMDLSNILKVHLKNHATTILQNLVQQATCSSMLAQTLLDARFISISLGVKDAIANGEAAAVAKHMDALEWSVLEPALVDAAHQSLVSSREIIQEWVAEDAALLQYSFQKEKPSASPLDEVGASAPASRIPLLPVAAPIKPGLGADADKGYRSPGGLSPREMEKKKQYHGQLKTLLASLW